MKFKVLLPISIISVVAIAAVGIGSNYAYQAIVNSTTNSGTTDGTNNDNTNNVDPTPIPIPDSTTPITPTATSNIDIANFDATNDVYTEANTFFSDLITNYENAIGNIEASNSITTSFGTSYVNITNEVLKEYIRIFIYEKFNSLLTDISSVTNLAIDVTPIDSNTQVNTTDGTAVLDFTLSVSYDYNNSNIYFSQTYTSTTDVGDSLSSAIVLTVSLSSYIVDGLSVVSDTSSTVSLPSGLDTLARSTADSININVLTTDYINTKNIKYTPVVTWRTGINSDTSNNTIGTIDQSATNSAYVVDSIDTSSTTFENDTYTVQLSATTTNTWYGINNTYTQFSYFTFSDTGVYSHTNSTSTINYQINRTTDGRNGYAVTYFYSWYSVVDGYEYSLGTITGSKDTTNGIIYLDISWTSTVSGAETEHLYLYITNFNTSA